MHMAPTEGRRRRDKGKSKAKKRKEAGRRTAVHDLPEHVFEQILLRLGRNSPFLVRAAATCKRWCRVVADAGFLARFATTGPPHVGDYRNADDGCSFFVPSTPLDVDDHRFSLDFLPDSESWVLADSRGSLLLLEKRFTHEGPWNCKCGCSPDLIVCDPLMARYQGILWPPDLDGLHRFGVFLADGDDSAGGRVSMSNFRIIAVIDETVVSVFTTGSDGGWRIVHSEFPDDPETITMDLFAGRANGSLYWGVQEDRTMVLVLDEATAAFSLAHLPENVWGLSDEETTWLIGGEDGVLCAVRLIGDDLYVFARRHQGCSNDDDGWVLEKQLGLPEATAGLPGHDEAFLEQEITIIMANAKYILLSTSDEKWVFSVELDTMWVEPRTYTGKVCPYELPWPPVLPDLSKQTGKTIMRLKEKVLTR